MWNCFAICAAAGATMEEDIGEMNVKPETTKEAAHFFFLVQL